MGRYVQKVSLVKLRPSPPMQFRFNYHIADIANRHDRDASSKGRGIVSHQVVRAERGTLRCNAPTEKVVSRKPQRAYPKEDA